MEYGKTYLPCSILFYCKKIQQKITKNISTNTQIKIAAYGKDGKLITFIPDVKLNNDGTANAQLGFDYDIIKDRQERVEPTLV